MNGVRGIPLCLTWHLTKSKEWVKKDRQERRALADSRHEHNYPGAPARLSTRHVYHLGCRRDALFEMLDALLTNAVIEHPVYLSLAPGFQRGWGSVYDALNAGTMPLPRLECLVAAHPLETTTAWDAVDGSVWPRCAVETSPQRGY
jgi:hypothetical protein